MTNSKRRFLTLGSLLVSGVAMAATSPTAMPATPAAPATRATPAAPTTQSPAPATTGKNSTGTTSNQNVLIQQLRTAEGLNMSLIAVMDSNNPKQALIFHCSDGNNPQPWSEIISNIDLASGFTAGGKPPRIFAAFGKNQATAAAESDIKVMGTRERSIGISPRATNALISNLLAGNTVQMQIQPPTGKAINLRFNSENFEAGWRAVNMCKGIKISQNAPAATPATPPQPTTPATPAAPAPKKP